MRFRLAVSLCCLLLPRNETMSQTTGDSIRFTAADLYQAFRFAMEDTEAWQVARDMAGETPEAAAQHQTTGISGLTIGQDVLVLMSLASDSLRLKVDRYRRTFPDYDDPQAQKTWEARVKEIRGLLERGELRPP